MDRRECRRCGETKDLDAFTTLEGNKTRLCKKCDNARRVLAQRIRRKQVQAFLNDVKDVPCTDCGNRYPHYVMDFDHVRGKKEFSIYRARQVTMAQDRLLAEIAKCEVVCANCHRQRTHERNPTPTANA